MLKCDIDLTKLTVFCSDEMTIRADTIKQILKSVEIGTFDVARARDADCLPEAVAHALHFLLRDKSCIDCLPLFDILCRYYNKHHRYSESARTALKTEILLQKSIHKVYFCRDVVLLTRGAYEYACDKAKSNKPTIFKRSVSASERYRKFSLEVVEKSLERKRLCSVIRKTDFDFCGLRNASAAIVATELTTLFDNICILRNRFVQSDKTDCDAEYEKRKTSEHGTDNDKAQVMSETRVYEKVNLMPIEEWRDLLVETCSLLLTLWHGRGQHCVLRSLVWLSLETSAMFADTSLAEFGKLKRHNRWLDIIRVLQNAESLLEYGKDAFLVYALLLMTRGRDADICLSNEKPDSSFFNSYDCKSMLATRFSKRQFVERKLIKESAAATAIGVSNKCEVVLESHVNLNEIETVTQDWLIERFDGLNDPDWSRSALCNTDIVSNRTGIRNSLQKQTRGTKRKPNECDDGTQHKSQTKLEQQNESVVAFKNKRVADHYSNNRLTFEVASRRKKYSDLPLQNQQTDYASQWFERCGILDTTNNRGVEQTFVCTLRDAAAEKFGNRYAIVFGPFEKQWQSRNIVFCHQLRQAMELPGILPAAEHCLETCLRADIYNRGALNFDIALNYVLVSIGTDLRPPILSLQPVQSKLPVNIFENCVDNNNNNNNSVGAKVQKHKIAARVEEEKGEQDGAAQTGTKITNVSWLSSAGVRLGDAKEDSKSENENRDRADWLCKCSFKGTSVYTRHQMEEEKDKDNIVSVFVTLAWRFMLGMNKYTSKKTLVRTGEKFDGRAVLDHWDIFNDKKSNTKLFQRKQSDAVALHMDKFLRDAENREALLSSLVLLKSRFSSDAVIALFENFGVTSSSSSSRVTIEAHKTASERLQMLIDHLETVDLERRDETENTLTDTHQSADEQNFWRTFF